MYWKNNPIEVYIYNYVYILYIIILYNNYNYDTRACNCNVQIQVSSDSAAPELENRAIYTRYFQMIPNEASLPIAFKTLFLTYGWHKLHTIAANNDIFVTVSKFEDD